MLARFHSLEKIKAETSTELERINTELRVEIVELKDQKQSEKQKCENLEEQLAVTKIKLDSLIEEMEVTKADQLRLLEANSAELDLVKREKSGLENSCKELTDELHRVKSSLTQKSEQEEEYKIKMETMREQLRLLNDNLNQASYANTNQLMEIEKVLEKCREELESSETNRQKIQEVSY